MDKRNFNSLFTFTAKEKRGLAVLLGLILVIILIRIFLPAFYNLNNEIDFSDYEIKLKNFRDSIEKINEKNCDVSGQFGQQPDYFEFDPNDASKSELQKLGFSGYEISTIINYRKSGGKFNSKKDLMKIYGIDISHLNELEPFIFIKGYDKNRNGDYEDKMNKVLKLNLNLANKEQLENIAGIGNILSLRIVKYRNLLGGFYSLEQLKEVYGINSQMADSLKEHFIIDDNDLIKMNLNTITENGLIGHPYLNEYQAKAILSFRNYKGIIENVDDIYNNHLISEEAYIKIKPYLSID